MNNYDYFSENAVACFRTLCVTCNMLKAHFIWFLFKVCSISSSSKSNSKQSFFNSSNISVLKADIAEECLE